MMSNSFKLPSIYYHDNLLIDMMLFTLNRMEFGESGLQLLIPLATAMIHIFCMFHFAECRTDRFVITIVDSVFICKNKG